jgi:4'-phosphopantetheinyl transferase
MRRFLCEGEVLLRIMLVQAVAQADWPRLAALLDDAEQEQAVRFSFEEDRCSYIAAHALLRSSLSELAPRASTLWRFTRNACGKPSPVLEPGEPDLRVNLSHTRGLVAVAIAHGRDVGVDVEWMARDNLTRNLALEVFAPTECEAVAVCPEKDLRETLFAFWTLKEAYIKARGGGLSIPLDSFAFTLDPLRITFAAPGGDDPARWWFRCLRPTPDHALALAARDIPLEVEPVLEEVRAGDLLAIWPAS